MAIEQSGSLLEFASKDIQNDKAMVQLAISNMEAVFNLLVKILKMMRS